MGTWQIILITAVVTYIVSFVIRALSSRKQAIERAAGLFRGLR